MDTSVESYGIDIQEVQIKLQKWIDAMAEDGIGKLINKEMVSYDPKPGRSMSG